MKENEESRLQRLWEKESSLQESGYAMIAGIDEVGRGPLAGPVVAACVVLPPKTYLPGLNDSKKVAPALRYKLAELIKDHAVAWGIGLVGHEEIDRINILQATKKAMVKAVDNTSQRPDYLLIDALAIPVPILQEAVVHGDSLCASIASASIIAKTYRDDLMIAMDDLYPQYGFKENKGYGTPRHLEALRIYGPCPIHRMSFLRFMV